MKLSEKYRLLVVVLANMFFVLNIVQASANHSKICIIRHAKVVISKPGWGKTSDAKKYKMEYNTSSVLSNIPENVQTKLKQFGELEFVYCSSLKRSQQTAKLLFGDSIEIITDTRFNELDYPVINVPFLKLPVKFWLSTSRLLWLLNLNNKEVGSFKKEKSEITELVEEIIRISETNSTIVIVGHGLQMRQMIKELEKKIGKLKILKGIKICR